MFRVEPSKVQYFNKLPKNEGRRLWILVRLVEVNIKYINGLTASSSQSNLLRCMESLIFVWPECPENRHCTGTVELCG
jgi:hypothetical protein